MVFVNLLYIMIRCSAPFCNNYSNKGYVFPKNPERRAQWVANMNVENWIPTDRSYLCEVHFSPEMWERRSDKKPKLKPNAVPTIFGYRLTKKTAFRQTEDKLLFMNSKKNEQCSIESMIFDKEQDTTDKEQLSVSMNSIKNEQNFVTESFVLNEEQNAIDKEHQTAAKQERENEKLKRTLDTQTKRFLRVQRQLKILRDTVRRMKDIISKDKYKKALKRILNEDQIKAVCNKQRTVHWSNKTIQRALQLKLACGTSGYEELLRQKIPLPNLHILRRKLEGFEFESGNSKEMCDFLKFKALKFEKNTDRECGLVVDEMSITQRHDFDPSTNTTLGNAIPPSHREAASWKDDYAVKKLIHLWKTNQPLFKNSKIRNDIVWRQIAKELQDSNPNWVYTGAQCENKFKDIRKIYVKVKDHNANSTGGVRKTCKYYEEMEEAFEDKPCIKPVATARILRKRLVNNSLTPTASSASTDEDEIQETASHRRDRIEKGLEEWVMSMRQDSQRKEMERERRHKEKLEKQERAIAIYQELMTKLLNKLQ